jgi:hypothetical protein
MEPIKYRGYIIQPNSTTRSFDIYDRDGALIDGADTLQGAKTVIDEWLDAR